MLTTTRRIPTIKNNGTKQQESIVYWEIKLSYKGNAQHSKFTEANRSNRSAYSHENNESSNEDEKAHYVVTYSKHDPKGMFFHFIG